MTDEVERRLRDVLPKNLLIDLEDRARAEALKAHAMVRDHSGLDTKRARELAGQARFRMMEKGFEEVCAVHGGKLLESGVIPKTDLKIFQPFLRFESDGQGIILGLAMMSEPKAVPHKNKSRAAGVSLNHFLSPQLALDDSRPKAGDIFVLFLCSRDRRAAGQIEEIAIGIINSSYEAFLFYEQLDKFLSGYADSSVESQAAPAATEPPAKVVLKKNVAPFVPPEASEPDAEKGSGAE